MTETKPVAWRIEADLKTRLAAEAARLNKSNTAMLEDALREHLALLCPTCGARRFAIPVGLTEEFASWVRQHKGQGAYIVAALPDGTRAFKGKLGEIFKRHVYLESLDRDWNKGEIRILLDFVIDFAEGKASLDSTEFRNLNPGIPIDPWGGVKTK